MPGTFGVNNVPYGNAGSLGSQFGAQLFHSPFTSNLATLNNALAGERNSSSLSLFPQLSGSVGQSFDNHGLMRECRGQGRSNFLMKIEPLKLTLSFQNYLKLWHGKCKNIDYRSTK
nr:zinc finger CCCH domain-containing protein 46 [Ipomoea batatas]